MFDLLVRDVRVVRHDRTEQPVADIAVRDGSIVAVAPNLPVQQARQVVEGRDRLAFPGVVDAHQHWGIYHPLEEDARSESRACAQGGVTTALTYIRTGQYYLNKGGPYRDFFPEVLQRTAGRAYVDYAFHVAPMMREHIDEIPDLVEQHGVSSFKIFMFYGGHGLHGRSEDQSQFLMTPPGERYDLAHFEFVMRGVQQARERAADRAEAISLSLHCETAEIMTAYTRMVEEQGDLRGLAAYHESRPPHSEGLAIVIASYLAHETGLPTINLLHLSSRKALDAALRMADVFPHVDFRREVTIGHLLTDIDTAAAGAGGKVNPPLRPRDDVEALWEHVLAGHIDWIVSDHACCRAEVKYGDPADDVFLAKSGFGGAEYLLPGLLTEASRRGLPYHQVAKLTAFNPAQRYGLWRKGVLAESYDADFCLVDPDAAWTVTAADSESTQDYTPFEGMAMTARVTDTFVRGQQVLTNSEVTGEPAGKYVPRPTSRPGRSGD